MLLKVLCRQWRCLLLAGVAPPGTALVELSRSGGIRAGRLRALGGGSDSREEPQLFLMERKQHRLSKGHPPCARMGLPHSPTLSAAQRRFMCPGLCFREPRQVLSSARVACSAAPASCPPGSEPPRNRTPGSLTQSAGHGHHLLTPPSAESLC